MTERQTDRGFIPHSLVLVSCLIACSPSSNKGGNGNPPRESPTPVGPLVSATIGPAGGALTSSDGVVTLTVPPGAVDGNTTFGIQAVRNPLADAGIGNAYELTPDGASFAVPVQLRLGFDPADIAGYQVGVAYLDVAGAWHDVTPVELDAANNTVAVSTPHFTSFVRYNKHWLLSEAPPTLAYFGPLNVGLKASIGLKLSATFFEDGRELEAPVSASAFGLEWMVFGDGTVLQDNPTVYTAPASLPPTNPQLVTVTNTKLGFTLGVDVWVYADRYRGTILSGSGCTAELTWDFNRVKPDRPKREGLFYYDVSGTVRWPQPPGSDCAFDVTSAPIPPDDADLRIDCGVGYPSCSYQLAGVIIIDSNLVCPVAPTDACRFGWTRVDATHCQYTMPLSCSWLVEGKTEVDGALRGSTEFFTWDFAIP